jgi:hypothetical protein
VVGQRATSLAPALCISSPVARHPRTWERPPPLHHASLSPPTTTHTHTHSLASQTPQDFHRLAAVCPLYPPVRAPACPPLRAHSSPWSTPATAFALCSAPSSDLPTDRGVTYEPRPSFPAKPWPPTLNSSPGTIDCLHHHSQKKVLTPPAGGRRLSRRASPSSQMATLPAPN